MIELNYTLNHHITIANPSQLAKKHSKLAKLTQQAVLAKFDLGDTVCISHSPFPNLIHTGH